MKKLYENEKYEFQREKPRAQVGPYLLPTGGLWGVCSAQVGRKKLSHEQNCLMRTKVRPAPGKTTLFTPRLILSRIMAANLWTTALKT